MAAGGACAWPGPWRWGPSDLSTLPRLPRKTCTVKGTVLHKIKKDPLNRLLKEDLAKDAETSKKHRLTTPKPIEKVAQPKLKRSESYT
jgi:hypothetical protein